MIRSSPPLLAASRRVAAAVVFSFVAALPIAELSAAPGILFQVNSSSDAGDASVGDGFCDTAVGNGVCTLRAAIQESNSTTTTTDGIRFSIPTSDPNYNPQTGGWTIGLGSALPDLSTSMNITATAGSKLTVQAGGTFRIFNVTAPGAVNISGLTLARGRSSQSGGAVSNSGNGTLTLTTCTLRNNVASSGGAVANQGNGTLTINNSQLYDNGATIGGGAIYNGSGTLNVTGSTIRNNLCNLIGGGLYNASGVATVTSTTVANNRLVVDNPAEVHGGGICSRKTLTLTNCTVSGNLARGPNGTSSSVPPAGFVFGGGISSGDTALNIVNSTISGNTAEGGNNVSGMSFPARGGGVYYGAAGTCNITNSTISANAATSGYSPFDSIPSTGGGVASAGNKTTHLKSSIIAENTAASAPDAFGSFVSHGFNLIGNAQGATGAPLSTDQLGTPASPIDPKLGPLQDNGGPTSTMPLQTGSPAIDKGSSVGLTGPLTTDQRGSGFARTVDHGSIANAAGGDGTDIGALERILAP